MTLTAPTYTIHCDEPGCPNSYTFLLSSTTYPGLYDLRCAAEVYSFYGGETLPDGKHRCATCRVNAGEEVISKISEYVAAIEKAPRAIEPLERAIAAAREYRDTESDGTPRLWRGKQLQDIAHVLDEALEAIPHPQTV